MPIVCSIDLYSPLVEILIYFTTFGSEKYSKPWEQYSLPPATAVRVDGNYHEFPWFWRLSVLLENICAGHTPLNFHIWTSEGQG